MIKVETERSDRERFTINRQKGRRHSAQSIQKKMESKTQVKWKRQ